MNIAASGSPNGASPRRAGMSRRGLLGAAALVNARSSAANSAITVGLLGSGSRGSLVAGFLTQTTGARLVALCDLYEDRVETAKRRIPVANPAVYTDYRKLLESDVDAVIIATPIFLHPEHFEAAVAANKHIYIEKPAGVDVTGCKRVIRAAARAGRSRNITFGFQARYGPGYHQAKQLLDSGGIGPLRMAHAHFIKGDVTGERGPVPRPRTEEERIRQWLRWRDTSGDVIVETYCHGIDVLNWFLGGHPLAAHGTGGRTIRRDGDNMDHVDVTFTYADNVQASLAGSQIAPPFYRSAMEQFFGSSAVIETSRQYWTLHREKVPPATQTIAGDITANAVSEFVRRIREQDPENTAARSAESTLTAIMGRMAIDMKRRVNWDEMMQSG